MRQTIQERIRQRRRQMLLHSYLYYERDVNIVSDSKWSKWAMELVRLQRDYPKESKEVEFYKEFIDWDGSSGAFLKFPESVKTVADRLYAKHTKKTKTAPVNKKTSARKLF